MGSICSKLLQCVYLADHCVVYACYSIIGSISLPAGALLAMVTFPEAVKSVDCAYDEGVFSGTT